MSLTQYPLTGAIRDDEHSQLCRGARRSDGAPVLLKLLKSDYPSPRDVARFKLEYTITRDLDLPGVLMAESLERHGSGLALVFEGFDGLPLSDLTRNGQIDLGAALWIAASVAGTLASIHQRGVIHKDLKPQSLLVDLASRRVKVTDFGSATRLSSESPRSDRFAAPDGTLAYMAPEQTGRVNRVVDSRADLYALGVVLYELCTRTLPFPSLDPLEVVHGHIARIPAPPGEIAPAVPEIVSEIVMRLLAKAAEHRYQHAAGLEADLLECLTQWDKAQEITRFPLGQRDRGGELKIPQKLYGRATESAALQGALARVIAGGVELVLVEGAPGAGKSALVNELREAAARERVYFISAEVEPIGRSTPYAPLVRACRALLQHILAESAGSLARWRRELLDAVGPSGRVLTDVLPELSAILGAQPDVPELAPTESQNRFRLVFQDFLRVFASASHPLVLALDALQWADAPSLDLLELLLTDPTSAHLLVIGARQCDEAAGVTSRDADDPVLRMVDAVRSAGVAVSTIALGPLPRAEARRLLAETLACGEERARPLAELVFAKTSGDPRLLKQLLGSLHEAALIVFDAESGSWTWDLAQIEATMIPGDQVAFAASRIRRLAPPAQRALALAACVGRRFDLTTLAALHGASPADAAGDLWGALEDGLVLPCSSEYRFLHAAGAGEPHAAGEPHPAGEAVADAALDVSYEFPHDRVQQAAHALLDEDERGEIHLRVARILRAKLDHAGADEALFDTVRHANLGAAWITDPRERVEIARLDLSAGKRAKIRGAYQVAAGYLEAAAALLGEAGWHDEYDLTFALHVERAECEHLAGRFDHAEALFAIVLSHARSDLERARVLSVRVVLYTTIGRIHDAMSVGHAALALLGIDLPLTEEAGRRAMEEELARVEPNLAGRSIASLIDAPALHDPIGRVALELLLHLQVPALLVSMSIRAYVVVRHVNLSLTRGHSDVSAFGYMAYGAHLARAFRRYDEAYAFGKLALALNERFGNTDLTCKLNFWFGSFLHQIQPLRSSLPYLTRAIDAGLASGDLQYLSFACCHTLAARIALSDDLRETAARASKLAAIVARTRDATAKAFVLIGRQLIDSLSGAPADRRTSSAGASSERSLMASLESPRFAVVATWHHTVNLQLLFLFGHHEAALAAALRADERSENSAGMGFTVDRSFFACLTIAALAPPTSAGEPLPHAAMLADHRGRLEAWAEGCPENYRHKRLLVDAELARVAGAELDAMALYDQAIEAARSGGYARDEALANELCATFHARRGRAKIARAYMTDAYYGYLRWGAGAKVADIADKYPDMLMKTAMPAPDARPSPIDVATLVRAAQAISEEIVLGEVLSSLMRIVLKNAGAQRGVLLLDRDGQLVVEATIRADPDTVEVGLAIPAEESADLALSIVQYVARTQAPVVLGEATRDDRFAADPYVVASQPRSVVCLALTHRGHVSGVLYLENNLTRDAFPPDRLEVLGVLSSQAAIAVRNAILYARVQAATDALRRANEGLESDVARRTEELSAKSEELERELARRERAEHERAELQDQIIRAQRARLSELSTPLIPITDRIMVMPLIGVLDAERARQVLEAAVEGAHVHRTRFMIVDVTGVKDVDSGVAGAVMGMVGALSLLGTRAVITGVQPDVAQALVGLSIDLGKVVTLATLQRGIAFALEQTGADVRQLRGAGPDARPPPGQAPTSRPGPRGSREGRGST